LQIHNNGFELGNDTSWEGWSQGSYRGNDKPAVRVEEDGNHFIRIPAPGDLIDRYIQPDESFKLPSSYSSIDIEAKVKGYSTSQSQLFGITWYHPYDKSDMLKDIRGYLDFGDGVNPEEREVPVMCLESGVIMKTTREQGHLRWLRDFIGTLVTNEVNEVHWAYHSWRSFTKEDPDEISFGIYQCWGVPATACSKQFTFVLPVLRGFMNTADLCPVRISNTPFLYFEDIQSAYEALLDQDIIQVQASDFPGDVVFDWSISVTLDGGYDSAFDSITGRSCIQGSLVILDGCVILKGMTIVPGP
jgi:hypothetical protein